MENLPQEIIDHIVDMLPVECEVFSEDFSDPVCQSDEQDDEDDEDEKDGENNKGNEDTEENEEDWEDEGADDHYNDDHDYDDYDGEEDEDGETSGLKIWHRLHVIPFVSRKFRLAMDRLIFRDMRITNDDVGAFEAAFASAHRRGFVDRIHYHINLCRYSEEAFPKFETAEDRKMNNKTATDAMASLFAALSKWSAEKAIGLLITMNSPSDIRQRPAVFDRENITDIGPERWRFSYVEVNAEDLPLVPCIGTFNDETEMHRGREISLLSTLALVAKMPNLEDVSFKHVEPTTFVKFCEAMRAAVIDSIETSRLPSSVTTATIAMKPEPCFYNQLLPNKLGPDGLGPSISSAMHHFVNNLTSLDYSGQIDSSFFWPRLSSSSSSSSDSPPPFWQSMKKLTVQFEMSTPSGEWYFKPSADQVFEPLPDSCAENLMPPGHNETVEDDALAQQARMVWLDQLIDSQKRLAEARHGPGFFPFDFRWAVNEDVMGPLVKAMAKAIAQMPRLEHLTLSCRRFNQGGMIPDTWYIEYRAPGNQSPRDIAADDPVDEDPTVEDPNAEDHGDAHVPGGAHVVNQPRFYILGVGWTPQGEVLQTLEDCTMATHGVPALVVSLDDRWQRDPNILQNDIGLVIHVLMRSQGRMMSVL